MESLNITTLLPLLVLTVTLAFQFLVRPRLNPAIDTSKPATRADRVITANIAVLMVLGLLEGPGTLLTIPLHLFAGYNAGKIVRETNEAVMEFRKQRGGRRQPKNTN